jgi:aspartate-semialdehyde dehydrogenase
MGLRVAVVGAGLVGDRILRCLAERHFPLDEPPLVLARTPRRERLADREVEVQPACAELFQGLDLVLFAGTEGEKGASQQWSECAIAAGAYCIDNGADYRLDPKVPLVVPEVNMDVVRPEHKLIASPNCSTIQVVVAIAPLHRRARIKRMVVTTFQSVSGAGKKAVQELARELGQLALGEPVEHAPDVFPRPIALDCLPHIGGFQPNGYTSEEMKLVHETRKILDAPDMAITATTVRVPVKIGHAAAVNLEFATPLSAAEAQEILQQAPGVVVLDGPTDDPLAAQVRRDPAERRYPTQADVLHDEYKDLVLVGRIRQDESVQYGLNLWVVADNLRKGAATNVVQIAEGLIARGFFPGKV